ncbi:hypothetical protein HYZ99_01755 [Candidatus Peregrinibacteria bacterium]|nr:hypothetical protein [Candidatus Peregrinibacteria bacterium]
MRALLASIVLAAYGAAKLGEALHEENCINAAEAAMKRFDPHAHVDFRSTMEEHPICSLSLGKIDDAAIAEIATKHRLFSDMVRQLCITDGNLTEKSFRHIAEMDHLEYLGLANGAEVTLDELRALQKSRSLQYLCIVEPDFTDDRLRDVLPHVASSTLMYADPFPSKFMRTHMLQKKQ